ncbi:hypothetical protein T492DRAFT_873480 [Pavlovales sp. CCMP2436]|nr:hypothetical protein T492DRAFT_873480 [Pavlovales sp. CCMP2436]
MANAGDEIKLGGFAEARLLAWPDARVEVLVVLRARRREARHAALRIVARSGREQMAAAVALISALERVAADAELRIARLRGTSALQIEDVRLALRERTLRDGVRANEYREELRRLALSHRFVLMRDGAVRDAAEAAADAEALAADAAAFDAAGLPLPAGGLPERLLPPSAHELAELRAAAGALPPSASVAGGGGGGAGSRPHTAAGGRAVRNDLSELMAPRVRAREAALAGARDSRRWLAQVRERPRVDSEGWDELGLCWGTWAATAATMEDVVAEVGSAGAGVAEPGGQPGGVGGRERESGAGVLSEMLAAYTGALRALGDVDATKASEGG